MEIVGYSDRLSVTAGRTQIRFMVSSRGDRFEAAVVRLVHGDDNPIGPGFIEEELDTDIRGFVPGAGPGHPDRVVGGGRRRPVAAAGFPDGGGAHPAHAAGDSPGDPHQVVRRRRGTGFGLFLDEAGRDRIRRCDDREVIRQDAFRKSRCTGGALVLGRRLLRRLHRRRSGSRSSREEIGGRQAGVVDSVDEAGAAGEITHSTGPLLMAAAWTGAGSGTAATTTALQRQDRRSTAAERSMPEPDTGRRPARSAARFA